MFNLTRQEFEDICYKAMLNDDLKKILEMKIKGETITKMSMELNLSERTINNRINLLKRKIKKVL